VSKVTVELVSFASEKEITRNSGFTLAFWAVVPFILSVALIAAGLVGQFSTALRGAYVLFGSIIGLPALLCLVVGITEYHTQPARVAYVNDAWFGPCCHPCGRGAEDEDDRVGTRDGSEGPQA
jgi:hypothetical protein